MAVEAGEDPVEFNGPQLPPPPPSSFSTSSSTMHHCEEPSNPPLTNVRVGGGGAQLKALQGLLRLKIFSHECLRELRADVLTACHAHVEGGGTKREGGGGGGGVEVSLTGQEQLMGGVLGKTPATLGWRAIHGNPMKVKFKGSGGDGGDGGGGGWVDSSLLFHPHSLLLALESTF